MAKMIATKAMSYATRRLKAGDEFTVTSRDARLLSAIGKASYSTRAISADPRSPADDISTLRAKYERVVGKKPFMGWKADDLKAKIAEAEG